jgi:hypothetical protein
VERFSFSFDYPLDGSRYFVSRGEQVVLIGAAKHNDPDVWGDDDALGEQFIEIAKRLKERYGTKLVDLVPTQKAEQMLNDGSWVFMESGWGAKHCSTENNDIATQRTANRNHRQDVGSIRRALSHPGADGDARQT